MSSLSLIRGIRFALGCRDDGPPLVDGPPPAELAASLAGVFAGARDRRGARGLRHQLPSLLATFTLAVACGAARIAPAASMAAGWDQQVLEALGCRRSPATGLFEAPSASTLGRLHKAVDVVALQADLVAWAVRWALAGRDGAAGPGRPGTGDEGPPAPAPAAGAGGHAAPGP
ncbi:transposase family protein [Parafrankia sp. FMc6]|uniref:transposase family protein n=1 Tax=Parafrankia soli TaxID=2599596 RepID=UPI0034D51AB1